MSVYLNRLLKYNIKDGESLMIRIGIVGSDSSHAEHFAKIVNKPDEKTKEYRYPDCKVTGIFGLERGRTEAVARDGDIEFIAEEAEELIGKVDAVMIVLRNGDLHIKYAMPFIMASMPMWIDKPFTITNEDALEIIETAEKYNTLITGGSMCKYVYDILCIRNAIQNGSRIGKIRSAFINFPAELEDSYGGIYFYGSHLVEMTLAAFGYDVKSVVASECGGNVIALIKYDAFQVAMHFIPELKEYHVGIFGDKGTIVREIDISLCYLLGFDKFVEMIRTRKLPMELYKLYTSVKVMNAVVESYKTCKEIFLE